MTNENLGYSQPEATATGAKGRNHQLFRAVSLWQPWAWAAVQGPKRIENRVWFADLRGPLWLHATGKTPRVEYERGRDAILYATNGELEVPRLAELVQGAVLGRVLVVDVMLPGGWSPLGADPKKCRLARGYFKLCGPDWGREHGLARSPFAGCAWHIRDQFGYVLEDRRALSIPVEANGHQRMWNMPRELVRRVLEVPLGKPRAAA